MDSSTLEIIDLTSERSPSTPPPVHSRTEPGQEPSVVVAVSKQPFLCGSTRKDLKRNLELLVSDGDEWLIDTPRASTTDSEDGSVYEPAVKKTSGPMVNSPKSKGNLEIGLPTPQSSAKKLGQLSRIGFSSSTPFSTAKRSTIYTSHRLPRCRRETITPTPFPKSPTPRPTIKSRSGRRRHGPVPKIYSKPDIKTLGPDQRRSQSRTKRTKPRPLMKGLVDIPRIGFRGYSALSQGKNSESGFRAGKFTHIDEIPTFPGWEEALSDATRHVGNDKSAPTSFISVTRNLIRAITRGCQIGKKSTPYLAVIDLHKLQELGTVYAAQDLNLKPPNVPYFARGEFLVWAAIREEAIISVIPMKNLYSPPPYHPNDDDPLELIWMTNVNKVWKTWYIRNQLKKKKLSISLNIGFAIGQLIRILAISTPLHESAVDTIIRDWRVEVKKHGPWQQDEQFQRGLEAGYNGGDIGPRHPDRPNQRRVAGDVEDAFPEAFYRKLEKDTAAFDEDQDFHAMDVAEDIDDVLSETSTLIEDNSATVACPLATISQDVIMSNGQIQLSSSGERQDKPFADLPRTYETEMIATMDLLERDPVRAYDQFQNLPVFYEKEMIEAQNERQRGYSTAQAYQKKHIAIQPECNISEDHHALVNRAILGANQDGRSEEALLRPNLASRARIELFVDGIWKRV